MYSVAIISTISYSQEDNLCREVVIFPVEIHGLLQACSVNVN